MKLQRFCCFLLSAGLLFSSCLKSVEEGAASGIPAKQQRLLIETAKDLYSKGNYTDALKALGPLSEQSLFSDEVFELGHKIKVGQFNKKMEQAHEQSSFKAIKEVEEKHLIPDSYGRTVSITGEKIEHKAPVKSMERLLNRRISMDLSNAGVPEILFALNRIEGINLIADSSLQSNNQLTVKVNEVPLKEVLNYIARNMGMDFHLGENTIWVTAAATNNAGTPKLETRIFRLKTGAIPTISESSAVPSDNAGTELDDALMAFLETGPQDATYRIYRNRNILIVKNTIDNMRIIEQLLEELDKPLKQVLIEARFVTITQSDLLELGYNLEKATPKNPTRESEVMTVSNNLLRSFPSGGDITLTGVIGNAEYTFVMHALDEMTSSQTISSPRVTVLNNHPAIIRRGETLRYYEEYELQTVTNTDGVSTSEPVPVGDVQEINLGINFEVKPTIGYDGKKIMLDLKPDVVEFLGYDEFISAKLPRTNESTVETKVVVDSGQTVVLGGMITDTKENDANKIPFLGRIPIIGHFFGHSNKSSNPSHLLIFVTTTIIDGSGKNVSIED